MNEKEKRIIRRSFFFVSANYGPQHRAAFRLIDECVKAGTCERYKTEEYRSHSDWWVTVVSMWSANMQAVQDLYRKDHCSIDFNILLPF